MSEKTRLIAECKRLDPAFRVQETLVPQGTVFQLVLGDGTTMRMQFERHRWSLAQQREVKLRMLREALIALRFVPRATVPPHKQSLVSATEFLKSKLTETEPKCSA